MEAATFVGDGSADSVMDGWRQKLSIDHDPCPDDLESLFEAIAPSFPHGPFDLDVLREVHVAHVPVASIERAPRCPLLARRARGIVVAIDVRADVVPQERGHLEVCGRVQHPMW